MYIGIFLKNFSVLKDIVTNRYISGRKCSYNWIFLILKEDKMLYHFLKCIALKIIVKNARLLQANRLRNDGTIRSPTPSHCEEQRFLE